MSEAKNPRKEQQSYDSESTINVARDPPKTAESNHRDNMALAKDIRGNIESIIAKLELKVDFATET